jgi:hypothetical protein
VHFDLKQTTAAWNVSFPFSPERKIFTDDYALIYKKTVKIMRLKDAVWLSICAFWLLIILWFLRLFNTLGKEYDVLISWISAASLILLGVFVGVLISEKKVQVRSSLPLILVFTAGFLAAPFVAVGVLMIATWFPFSRGSEPIIYGGSITGYLLLYMLLWFWVKKKDIRFGKAYE